MITMRHSHATSTCSLPLHPSKLQHQRTSLESPQFLLVILGFSGNQNPACLPRCPACLSQPASLHAMLSSHYVQHTSPHSLPRFRTHILTYSCNHTISPLSSTFRAAPELLSSCRGRNMRFNPSHGVLIGDLKPISFGLEGDGGERDKPRQ